MEDTRLKIGVIGAGAVGSASLLSLVCRGDAREIVVVNRDRKRARAVATEAVRLGARLEGLPLEPEPRPAPLRPVFIGRAAEQVDEFLQEEVEPVRRRYPPAEAGAERLHV